MGRLRYIPSGIIASVNPRISPRHSLSVVFLPFLTHGAFFFSLSSSPHPFTLLSSPTFWLLAGHFLDLFLYLFRFLLDFWPLSLSSSPSSVPLRETTLPCAVTLLYELSGLSLSHDRVIGPTARKPYFQLA